MALSIALSTSEMFRPNEGTRILVSVAKLLRLSIYIEWPILQSPLYVVGVHKGVLSLNLYYSFFCKETRTVSVLVFLVLLGDSVSVKLEGRLRVGQGDAGEARRESLFLCVCYM